MLPNITEINEESITITQLGNPKYLEIKQHTLKNSQMKEYFFDGRYFN